MEQITGPGNLMLYIQLIFSKTSTIFESLYFHTFLRFHIWPKKEEQIDTLFLNLMTTSTDDNSLYIEPLWKSYMKRSFKNRLIYTLQTKPTIFQSTVAQRLRYSLRGLRQIFLWPSCISFLVQRWEESLRVWGSETKPSFPRRRLCSAPTASCGAPPA